MENASPLALVKQVEAHLISILSAIDLYVLPAKENKLITTLRREIVDARLDVRDYELSEARVEQLENARIASNRLEQVRKNILSASEYNVFSAVDVSQLTAQIEQVIEDLK